MICLEINNKDLYLFCIILIINVCDVNREIGGGGIMFGWGSGGGEFICSGVLF